MTKVEKGHISEAKAIAELTSAGYQVSIPVGSHVRYDLVAEKDGSFYRVQVKTGWLINDGEQIKFKVSSSTVQKGERIETGYENIDLFFVYCHELNTSYIVPDEDTPSLSMYLRIKEPKRNLSTINYAKDYEVH